MNDLKELAEDLRLSAGEYRFDQLLVGQWFETAGVTVTESHVVGFAGISGDLFDVHMDDDFAKKAGFPGRIAHGLLGLSLADGLKTRCNVRLLGIATLGWNWSFKGPIFIGDRLSVRICIAGLRETKRADRGIATLSLKVLNQSGEIVQEGESLLMMVRGAA